MVFKHVMFNSLHLKLKGAQIKEGLKSEVDRPINGGLEAAVYGMSDWNEKSNCTTKYKFK